MPSEIMQITFFSSDLFRDVCEVFKSHGVDLDDGDALLKVEMLLMAYTLKLLKHDAISDADVPRIIKWVADALPGAVDQMEAQRTF